MLVLYDNATMFSQAEVQMAASYSDLNVGEFPAAEHRPSGVAIHFRERAEQSQLNLVVPQLPVFSTRRGLSSPIINRA